MPSRILELAAEALRKRPCICPYPNVTVDNAADAMRRLAAEVVEALADIAEDHGDELDGEALASRMRAHARAEWGVG